MRTLFISDLHLSSDRIRILCERPFASVEEMHKTFITNWNSVVKQYDTVYILGDIADQYYLENISVLKNLLGKKILILGNHDDIISIEAYKAENIFDEICHYKIIELLEKKVILFHYPIMDWDDMDYGSAHIYGHIHNKHLPKFVSRFKGMEMLNSFFAQKQAYNCGADVIGFKPRSFDELVKIKAELYGTTTASHQH